ncbi:hypothetical protein GGF46_002073 [Coemansia sp. RSA 552]|nr:hypothetical protein GGF46_002073 [Coemansia sp. RSA 552]
MVVSGEAPTEPVVSTKTGRVYERRLLQKYLEENGYEPQTEHSLAEEDIVTVNVEPTAVKPRPPTLTSIPALLATFQNEWDALVLETFTLKQQYQQVRQELSQALYQNDAACRVIARVTKERDEARETLATLQATSGSGALDDAAVPTDSGMDVDNTDAPAEADKDQSPEEAYFAKASETARVLSKSRMKREVPAGLVSADDWKTAKESGIIEFLHTSTKPGIISLEVDKTGDLALTGGLDNHAEVYSRKHDLTLATLKGHTKKVTTAVWVNGGGLDQRIITGSADKSIRIWRPKVANTDEAKDIKAVGWTKERIIKQHSAEIVGISIHPSGEYFASAAADGAWAIHALEDGSVIIKDSVESSQISKIAFHPDGTFLGVGTLDGYAKVIDVAQRQVLATLDLASSGMPEAAAINGLHFSENGYYFVTTSAYEAAVWDLRKQKAAHLWRLHDLVPNGGHASAEPVEFTTACFDASGKYLAIVAAGNIYVFKVKGWTQLAILSPIGDSPTYTVAWCGNQASTIAVATMENTLQYFAPAPANS